MKIVAYIFLCFLILFFGVNCNAQTDSIKHRKIRINPYFVLDNSNSFVKDKSVDIYGARAGFSINEKTRIGVGGNIIQEVLINQRIKDGKPNDILFRFRYITGFYERVLFKNFRWELSLPLSLGIGKAKIREVGSFDRTPVTVQTKTAKVALVNLVIDYKIRPWIGVGGGIGYRYLITDEQKAKDFLNKPFYSYGVAIYLDYWWSLVFNKERKNKIVETFFNDRDLQQEKRKARRETKSQK